METDDRLLVVLGMAVDSRPGDWVMDLPPPAAHAPGCACCAGRDPLATALAAAFVARGRGTLPWFDRVLLLAGAADWPRVAAVLTGDPVALARFRGPEAAMHAPPDHMGTPPGLVLFRDA